MLDVCLLGSGGMMPLPYRFLTSLMTRFNGSSLMIDCGEGTQVAVEKLMKRVNLNDNESMYYFHKTLDELGVSQRLKEMGIKDGDSVTIAGWELEWED